MRNILVEDKMGNMCDDSTLRMNTLVFWMKLYRYLQVHALWSDDMHCGRVKKVGLMKRNILVEGALNGTISVII